MDSVVVCWLTLTTMLACAGAGEPQRVLILDSFGPDFAPWSYSIPALKTELVQQSPTAVEIHEISLKTARFGAAPAEDAFVGYLGALYASRPPDLAVLMDMSAAQFWVRHRDALFPRTPMVLSAIDERVLRTLTLRSNDTAVVAQLDPSALVEVVLQVLPETTNIAVVVGKSPLEQYWAAQCRQDWQSFSNRVRFTWLDDLPFLEMCRRAAALPPRSVIGFGALVVDAAGIAHEQTEALDRLCAAANVPVFGLYEEQLGHGILGGRLFSGETLGRATARAAAQVLRGEKRGSFTPPVTGTGPPVFDWRELQRWHIRERQLPPGSLVRFRQPSIWERSRWYVAGACGIILVQGLFIVALLAQRRRRRRAEAALRANQQFMELATEAAPYAIVMVDHEGKMTLVNAAAENLFGYARNELIGQRADLLVPEPGRAGHDGRCRTFRDQGHARVMGAGRELFARRKDGSQVPVEIRLNPVTTVRGRFVLASVLDLTERHKAELASQRHRSELAHAGRVHVLGQLSSALAHELNQPLGAILSNTEAAELFLQSDTPSLEEIRAILGDIRKDDQRASDVIRRMRALLQRHEMESVPLSPAELIEDSIALARPDAVARRVKMESDIAPAVPTVRGDRVQLEQVLLNLLLNGMDALQGCPVEHRRLLVRAQRGADHSVEFAVTDSGPGIAVDKLDRLFESFYSTKPKGMGLGLSISRTIVEAHHGRLWAENNPEGGATFRFTLPMAPGQE